MTHDRPDQPHPERLMRGALAARSLSEVLWETLQDAVAESQAARVAELSGRLAEISLTVASLANPGHRPALERQQAVTRPHGVEPARARGPAPKSVPPDPVPESVVPEPVPESVVLEPVPESVVPEPVPEFERTSERRTSECDTDLAPEHGPLEEEHDGGREPATTAVLVDELASHDQHEGLGASRSEAHAQPSIEIRDERIPTEVAQDALIEQEHARHQERARHGYTEPAHTDTEPARAERGPDPAPWILSIERRLERYQQDGHAFALLLLELADVQRLRHAELPGEVARLTGLVETELSGQLRPADALMRETPGRYWLLAPQTDSASAQALARELTEAVGRAVSHRGTPLRLAAGIAVCAQDALSASELVARAERGLYAAHASGRSLATGEEVDRATGGSSLARE